MSNHDWSQFTRSIFIKAPVERVFDAWLIPDQIETWFLRDCHFEDAHGVALNKSERAFPGVRYTWKWWNWDGSHSDSYTLVDREKHICEFGFIDSICKVRVEVKEVNGDTLLTLIQSEIPTDESSKVNYHLGCGQGWSFWMLNLKSWLEHGILLHDKESPHKTSDYGFCELINR